MKRVYYLEIERLSGVDVVKGIQFIHGAILEIEGTQRKLIQDTSDAEHTGLVAVANAWRDATLEETTQLTTMLIAFPPDRNWQAEFDAAILPLDKIKVLARKVGLQA